MTLGLRGVVLGLLLAAAGCRSGGGAPVDEVTARALGELKHAIVEGHRTRDRAALDTLYAEDYLATDPRGGARTKADLLGGLATGPEMLEGAYTLTAARRWGDVAVAAGHGRMVFRDADSTRVVEYDSVNVFEWRDGRWWYVAAYLP